MSRIQNEGESFTPEQRRNLLDAYFKALGRWETADIQGRSDDEAIQAISDLWDQYRDKTPLVRISKNPFTGQPFDHSIDVLGLDGLWWNYRQPTRPPEALPPTVVAFTGAIRLAPPVEVAPFLCKPGPGLPFVVPRVLEQDGVKAVLSSTPVGAHTGYAIVYFAEQEMRTCEGFNTWGLSDTSFSNPDDEYDYGWYSWPAAPEDFDFDLKPWIESGKLQWIAPDDSEVNLRTGLDGCPYVGLEGERLLQVVQDGKVWTEEPWYVEEPPEVVDMGEPVEEPEPEGVEVPEQPAEPEVPAEPASPSESTPEAPHAGPRFCRECGSPLRAGAKFCGSCGTPL